MNPNQNKLTDGLLARLPQPADLISFRRDMADSIEKNRIRLRREHALVTAFWIFCAASATAYLWFGSGPSHFPRAPFLACIFFLWGGIELLKHHLNIGRVETMKEIKQLQLQILELHEVVDKQTK